jgi:Acetyltransferases
MSIAYKDKKDLPCEQLDKLFISAGWSDSESPHDNSWFKIPFTNSTLVISAWENDCLVGVVRVLSDTFGRSVIYDLVVLPEYQNKGIGTELIKRCIERFPNSEWLVQTTEKNIKYYEKFGFKIYEDVVLTIPSKYR